MSGTWVETKADANILTNRNQQNWATHGSFCGTVSVSALRRDDAHVQNLMSPQDTHPEHSIFSTQPTHDDSGIIGHRKLLIDFWHRCHKTDVEMKMLLASPQGHMQLLNSAARAFRFVLLWRSCSRL